MARLSQAISAVEFRGLEVQRAEERRETDRRSRMPSVEEVNNFRYSLTALKRVMPELSGLPRRERALLRQIVEMLESRLASQERAIAAKAKPKPIPNLSV